MQNLIKADFNGTNVLFKNDGYLNATSIAKGFGKQPKDYLKTEQTKAYIKALAKNISTRTKILVKENQLVSVKNGGDDRGTWLHPKLAVHFARWLSAEFAVWCDEQIEKILHGNKTEQPKLDDLSTSDDRVPLRQAVSKLVSEKGLLYPYAYNIVNDRMGTEHIDEMTVSQVEKATDFVYYLMANDVLEGELMPREPAQEKHYINKNKKNRLAGITLMKYGSLARMHQDEELRKLDKMLTEAQDQLKKAMQYNGALYDGFSEAWFQLSFAPEECREACKRANEWFKEKYSE